MKKTILSLLILAGSANAADWHKLHRWAEVSIMISTGADIQSSLGKHELNPVLGTGTFGARQIAIKIPLAVIPILVLELHGRHHEDKAFTVGTFIGAGAMGAVAIHNEGVK